MDDDTATLEVAWIAPPPDAQWVDGMINASAEIARLLALPASLLHARQEGTVLFP